MTTDSYILFTAIINGLYLSWLLSHRQYRLVLPSVMTCFTWFVATILMYGELKGLIIEFPLSAFRYERVAPFIFGMNLSAIVCFVVTHSLVEHHLPPQPSQVCPQDTLGMCNELLYRFKWVLWVCVGVGVTLVVFFLTLGIDITSFSDYRIMAVTVEKVGIAALAKRIGGHIGIIGGFYLMILGYKQAQTELDIRELLKCILMYSAVNLSIGGRVWLLASTLPYVTGYMFGKSQPIVERSQELFEQSKANMKKLGMVLVVWVSLFSILGNLRSDESYQKGFFEKFLYYTDGAKVSNIVLSMYPDGSYPLEYGQASIFNSISPSNMTTKFKDAIKDDIGLSVTVRSCIPALYYDFGFWGGMIMWGVLCGILELICLRIQFKGTLFSILWFCTLADLPFQSPIAPPFLLAFPAFEWLLLLWLLRKYIFVNYNPKVV
ncbi:MAG: oligosaccharide repeat unit polymerase [Bacteroides sp.]|nr:oligosaccharide repeat unit polymerase [Bacteroides sp.]